MGFLFLVGILVAGVLFGSRSAPPRKAPPLPGGGGGMHPAGALLTQEQITALAQTVGWSPGNARIAAAIAMAESGGYEENIGDNGDSFGLWQINLPSHPQYRADPKRLLEAQYNAQAAYDTWISAHRSFAPWSTYRSINGKRPAYLQYMR